MKEVNEKKEIEVANNAYKVLSRAKNVAEKVNADEINAQLAAISEFRKSHKLAYVNMGKMERELKSLL